MKSLISTSLLIILSQFLVAQKLSKAKILFTNDKVIEGFAFIGDSYVSFQQEIDGRKITYRPLGIKSVFVYQDNEEIEYRFRKFKNQYVLMRVIIDGNISLLSKAYYYNLGVGGNYSTNSAAGTLTHFFLNRKDEKDVVRILTKGKAIDKSFRKTAIEFFKDCPELVKKLDDKIFKKDDIEQVVNYYNKNCFY